MSLRDVTERAGVNLRQPIDAMTVALIRRHLGVTLSAIIFALKRHAMRAFKMPVAVARCANRRFDVVTLAAR